MQTQNDKWAYSIIDQLVQQGVTTFFIAPGSRSTSLVLAADSHPKSQTEVFLDERALSFMALGKAKALNKPVAIIVTSGSALANLYPAVIEAHQSHIPLVLLTADRPYEMVSCGQNQAIEQKYFFSSYTKSFLDLPAIEDSINIDYLASSIANTIFICKNQGPVQINCPFRKPFYSDSKELPPYKKAPTFFEPTLAPNNETVERLAKKLINKQGLIILAELPIDTDLSPIIFLAEKLGWPIFADPLSGVHNQNFQTIKHYELILKSNTPFKLNTVLQFGNRFISQALLDKLQAQNLESYIHITPFSNHYDPSHLITDKVLSSPSLFAEMLSAKITPTQESPLLSELKEIDQRIEKVLSEYFSNSPLFTESSIIHHLAETTSPNNRFFFANSMPIRDCITYFHPKSPTKVFVNRGASGIDGNLSTTIGIHKAYKTGKTFGVIGDQATLHDLNSLAFLANKKETPHFLIFNNKGGGIFSRLPIKNKEGVFSRYFEAKHDLDFEHIAKQFKLSYQKISSINELIDFNSETLPTFIEFTTNTQVNLNSQEEVIQKVKEALLDKKMAYFS